MRYLKRDQNIIVWGGGNVGLRIIKRFSADYNIRFIVDNKLPMEGETVIEGFPAYNPAVLKYRERWTDSMIVLCMLNWRELKEQLEELELRIFEDFIPWIYLDYDAIDLDFIDFLNTDEEKGRSIRLLAKDKKICGLYGFCHMNQYRNFLNSSKEFLDRYIFLNIPVVNDVENRFHRVIDCEFIWSSCDLFIATGVYEINVFDVPTTEKIVKKLNRKCKKILITSASFKGYFPQHAAGIRETNQYFAWGDKNINKMIKQGFSGEDIVDHILNSDIYSPEFVISYFDRALRILEKEEKKCDVKIADYIRENGRKRLLFYSWTHPVKEIMTEIGRRLFAALELDASVFDDLNDNLIIKMNTNEELIYPCVVKALGMEEPNKIIGERRMNPAHRWASCPLTVKEYIEGYVSMNRDYIRAGGSRQ